MCSSVSGRLPAFSYAWLSNFFSGHAEVCRGVFPTAWVGADDGHDDALSAV